MNRMVSSASLVQVSRMCIIPLKKLVLYWNKNHSVSTLSKLNMQFSPTCFEIFSNISILLIRITYFINGKLIVLVKYLQYLYDDNHFMRQTEILGFYLIVIKINTVQQNANNSLYRHDVSLSCGLW